MTGALAAGAVVLAFVLDRLVGEFPGRVHPVAAFGRCVTSLDRPWARPRAAGVAIACHPNNPTGDAYDDERLRAFARRCREAGVPLLVDEAFLGFTDRPSLAGEPGVAVAPPDGGGDTDPLPDLGARGVVLRDATTFRGLDSHVRIAVKRREANDRLLEVLGV